MATWIQSLSWTLVYALGQGAVVYTSLWVVLKLMRNSPSGVKYHLSLSALTVLFGWFVITWWQQYHAIATLNEHQYVSGLYYDASVYTYTVYDPGAGGIWPFVRMVMQWIPVFYLAGLMFMIGRLSAGMLQVFSLRSKGLVQPDAVLREMLNALKTKLHLEAGVQLFISARAQVPMAIGFVKPMILMPAATMAQLTTQQMETIILHELAHIKRHDYLVNILQAVAETILFFNPFVWLISGIIRSEREHCCDDLVLEHTIEPLSYATALAALANSQGAASGLMVAASGKSNNLFNRIKRIMEMKKNRFSYSRMTAAILIIAAIASSIAWLTPSFTKKKMERQEQPQVAASKGKQVQDPARQETDKLIQRLTEDKLIDAIKGFSVVKSRSTLIINGQQQTDETASKYLEGVKQEQIRVQVYPFGERVKMHPGAGLLQLLDPTTFESPCVDYSSKPGC